MKLQLIKYFKSVLKKTRVLRKVRKEAIRAWKNNEWEAVGNLIDRYNRILETI